MAKGRREENNVARRVMHSFGGTRCQTTGTPKEDVETAAQTGHGKVGVTVDITDRMSGEGGLGRPFADGDIIYICSC